MTENQSVVEKIAMINCGEKILKFFSNRPLTSGPSGPAGVPGGLDKSNPDIHSFICDPIIQSGRIPVKRLRIIRESNRACTFRRAAGFAAPADMANDRRFIPIRKQSIAARRFTFSSARSRLSDHFPTGPLQ
ncbi:hypothetical protein [Burkholderia sp. RF2-non_BP3]|uniref:hypothetical protein n=1 Tax=Burkholderia sp. RF2-non_BP3 TaxID=1637844 RepID=UPI0015D08A03|nr:hypothetical protein [Burkholderia sp. RF2-non_BP3]